MRLWSIHPKYLDAKGLVALWREALLAKHVLEGRTRGYTCHPQLLRFKALQDPVAGIRLYLVEVHEEATGRGYHFDAGKIGHPGGRMEIAVTTGQIEYERLHLLRKLKVRDGAGYDRLLLVDRIEHFRLFKLEQGSVAPWEKV